jgi:hypothetical protein
MTYVAWAALYEGTTDEYYFNVLVPKLMEHLVAARGRRSSTIPATPAAVFKRGTADFVARQICAEQEAIHIAFVHADTGGRNLEREMAGRGASVCDLALERCDWPRDRCIVIAPRHETEAWVLADPAAVCEALGYNGTPGSIGLPLDAARAERLVDPKATLAEAAGQVRGRRRSMSATQLLAAIAQRQRLGALRGSPSFRSFEGDVVRALRSLRCL